MACVNTVHTLVARPTNKAEKYVVLGNYKGTWSGLPTMIIRSQWAEEVDFLKISLGVNVMNCILH
jgi:hypothetical protein